MSLNALNLLNLSYMKRFALALGALALALPLLIAQGRGGRGMPASGPRIEGPMRDIRWRQIGPFRGGRVLAVAGVTSQPQVYYFGATGGGVFKTTDGGAAWIPVSDGQFANGDVGSIAVAESDPNVVYAGMGEACIRGNASPGDGVYKSTDAGRTWKNVGLKDTQQIGTVCRESARPQYRFRRRAGPSVRARMNSAASSDRPTAARPGNRS